MKRFLRDNSLAIFFLAIFLLALGFQSLAGWQDFNNSQLRHDGESIGYGRYLLSSEFGVAMLENWQSEYLQFALYITATVWFLQRGSPESKELDQAGSESNKEQKIGRHADDDSPLWARVGGLRTRVYSNSLLIVMGTIWLLSWLGQSITGRVAYNAERLEHHQAGLDYVQYLGSADFWERTLQNWQSEFLAVGSMAILAVYLRQRGSPESKPVGEGHGHTGVTG
ncbi:MAG TPA: DUF6766 family protein [Thermoleophilaceae bacterium]|nr:DUF6766 family protein [Thermoleophilaceae bacterium]